MSTVTVEVSPRLASVVRSPAFVIVTALQGVSISFAPLFLYWSGKGMFKGHEWLVVPICFAIVVIVPLVYFALGNAVIRELRKKSE